mmetsp:Transcript_26205/g.76497  ORF Transcript_26205/g.76497 Transcript_26205/m.76497 type:complete len:227 (-) Transcript_26205:12-692(-)
MKAVASASTASSSRSSSPPSDEAPAHASLRRSSAPRSREVVTARHACAAASHPCDSANSDGGARRVRSSSDARAGGSGARSFPSTLPRSRSKQTTPVERSTDWAERMPYRKGKGAHNTASCSGGSRGTYVCVQRRGSSSDDAECAAAARRRGSVETRTTFCSTRSAASSAERAAPPRGAEARGARAAWGGSTRADRERSHGLRASTSVPAHRSLHGSPGVGSANLA